MVLKLKNTFKMVHVKGIWPEIFSLREKEKNNELVYTVFLGSSDVSPLLVKSILENEILAFTEVNDDNLFSRFTKEGFYYLRPKKELEKFLCLLDRLQLSVRVYVTDEGCLSWLTGNHPCLEKQKEVISMLKDKFVFRQATSSLYPGVEFYRAKEVGEIFPGKYIVKPVRGFYGIGVSVLEVEEDSKDKLQETINSCVEKVKKEGDFCSSYVLSPDDFIIESYIPGPEIAVDMMWNKETSSVIILSIYHHPSLGQNILYYSCPKIIYLLIEKARACYADIASLNSEAFSGVPVHGEFKLYGAIEPQEKVFHEDATYCIEEDNKIFKSWKESQMIPIEINPCRFGSYGLCDMTYQNYGCNPYTRIFSTSLRHKQVSPFSGENLFPAITTFLVALGNKEKKGPPDVDKLKRYFPGLDFSCFTVDWKNLPFYALLNNKHLGCGFISMVSSLEKINWEDFISEEDSKEDVPGVIRTDKLTYSLLHDLFFGKIAAIILPNYLSKKRIDKILDYTFSVPSVDYQHEIYEGEEVKLTSYGVRRIGPSLNNCYRSLASEERGPEEEKTIRTYEEEGREAHERLREICAPHCTPMEKVLLDLNKVWPTGARVATFKDVKTYSGIIRHMPPGDPYAKRLEEEPHVDCLPDYIADLRSQISVNVYLQMPEKGGSLLISPYSHVYTPQEIRSLSSNFQANLGGEETMKSITPKVGEAIFINTRMLHGVTVPLDHRVTVQSFIGLGAEEAPLEIWN